MKRYFFTCKLRPVPTCFLVTQSRQRAHVSACFFFLHALFVLWIFSDLSTLLTLLGLWIGEVPTLVLRYPKIEQRVAIFWGEKCQCIAHDDFDTCKCHESKMWEWVIAAININLYTVDFDDGTKMEIVSIKKNVACHFLFLCATLPCTLIISRFFLPWELYAGKL